MAYYRILIYKRYTIRLLQIVRIKLILNYIKIKGKSKINVNFATENTLIVAWGSIYGPDCFK